MSPLQDELPGELRLSTSTAMLRSTWCLGWWHHTPGQVRPQILSTLSLEQEIPLCSSQCLCWKLSSHSRAGTFYGHCFQEERVISEAAVSRKSQILQRATKSSHQTSQECSVTHSSHCWGVFTSSVFAEIWESRYSQTIKTSPWLCKQ